MKFMRIFFSIVLLLVIVGAFVVAGLVFFIDPNRLKPVIADEVKQRTGYQVVIDGNLSWSFYPRFGVKVERMTISAPNQTMPFIDLKDMTLATELSQLIYGKEKLTGDVYISTVNFMQARAQNAHVGMHWEDHVLTLQPVTASLYEGSLDAKVHISDLAGVAKTDWDAQLSQVQLKPLLQDVNGADSRIKVSGVGQVKLQLTTQGLTREDVLSHLNGKTEFTITHGAVEGIDINYLVQTAELLINKQPIVAPESNQTNFDSVVGSAVITNGVANTQDVILTSPVFVTKVEGAYDLLKQTLDYQLQISPLQPGKIQWTVPVIVAGDIRHPEVRLDALKLEALVTKEKLEKIGKKLEKEIKKLPEEADRFLKRLIKK